MHQSIYQKESKFYMYDVKVRLNFYCIENLNIAFEYQDQHPIK